MENINNPMLVPHHIFSDALKLAVFFRDWRFSTNINKQIEYELNCKKLNRLLTERIIDEKIDTVQKLDK